MPSHGASENGAGSSDPAYNGNRGGGRVTPHGNRVEHDAGSGDPAYNAHGPDLAEDPDRDIR